MLDLERSRFLLNDLLGVSLDLPFNVEELFVALWKRGETFVLSAPDRTRAPSRYKDWVANKQGELFGFTAYDLESKSVVLEKRAKTIYWIISNLDASYSHDILSESLRENFKESSLWVVTFTDTGEFDKFFQCKLSSDGSEKVEAGLVAYTLPRTAAVVGGDAGI